MFSSLHQAAAGSSPPKQQASSSAAAADDEYERRSYKYTPGQDSVSPPHSSSTSALSSVADSGDVGAAAEGLSGMRLRVEPVAAREDPRQPRHSLQPSPVAGQRLLQKRASLGDLEQPPAALQMPARVASPDDFVPVKDRTQEWSKQTSLPATPAAPTAFAKSATLTPTMTAASSPASASAGKPSSKFAVPASAQNDRSIASSGKVGGFVESEIPLDPGMLKTAKGIKEGSGKYVAIMINAEHTNLFSDNSGSVGSSASAVAALMPKAAPRYFLLGLKKLVFIYYCPDSSERRDRMIYSTTKGYLLRALKNEGINPSIQIEANDPTDITDDALLGKQPVVSDKEKTKTITPKASASLLPATAPPGSLSSFMAKSLGHSSDKPKKRIVMPPPGAYG